MPQTSVCLFPLPTNPVRIACSPREHPEMKKAVAVRRHPVKLERVFWPHTLKPQGRPRGTKMSLKFYYPHGRNRSAD